MHHLTLTLVKMVWHYKKNIENIKYSNNILITPFSLFP